MLKEIKEKIELDKVTHSVRAAQAVLQYGVGAMVDFPDQTLVTAAPETWGMRRNIYDERFAKALGVSCFALPLNISYARFPEWYFCPKCRKFQPLDKWIRDYRSNISTRHVEKDKNMIYNMQCDKCRQDIVVARIVTVCEDGHLNDFPWIQWVHTMSKRKICGNPSLQFKTGASGTEGLEGLNISCSCGASATLKKAFDKDCFRKIDDENETQDFICPGNHPFRHIKQSCSCYPRTVQRGASSVYFPVVYSSLVIPPYSDKLNSKIDESQEFETCVAIINDEEPEDRIEVINKKLSKWSKKIAMEIGESSEAIEKVLKRKWLEDDKSESDVTNVSYRMEEYEALTGEITSASGTLGDFSREEMNIEAYNLPHIKSISLIDKIRVVNALVGFSRIVPATSKKDPGFVDIKEYETNWYPAYEVRGEGIFIEFDINDINKWIENNPEVVSRTETIKENYRSSYLGKNNPKAITPKFIMLHTLSHLLIQQLSFECGYSVASLSERLYYSEVDEGKEMAGIFIYTANGDSEGTLGGLVRQGRADTFPRIMRKAIASAQNCSNDPVCILSHGQGRDSLNLAACHACGLLPETCCEERNGFLDRGLIVGTYDKKNIGFWSDI